MDVGEFSTGSSSYFVIEEDENPVVDVLRIVGGEEEPHDRRVGKAVEEIALFAAKKSVMEEMEFFKQLEKDQPEYARQIVLQGLDLIELASLGDIETLAQVLSSSRENEIMIWTVTKMFKAACACGKVNVVLFMLENGISRSQPGLSHLLHELLEETENENLLLETIPVLVRRSDFSVNTMRKGDGITPLHIACQRSHLNMFKLLVTLGADVHAIANDDTTPLLCAKHAVEVATTIKEIQPASAILKFLETFGKAPSYQSYSG